LNLSVLLPTTGRRSLSTALTSADESALTGGIIAELIVIDDRLLTSEPIEIPCGLKSAVRVVKSGGRGLSAARNVGWASASGEYVAFLDDDDTVCPHHFCTLIQTCENHPENRGAYAAVNNIVRTEGPDGRVNVFTSPGFGWHFSETQLQVANIIVPSSALLRHSGNPIIFDENLSVQEDWEAWLRLLSRGERLEYTGQATTAYAKDVIASHSSTVRASCELDMLRNFAQGYDALCHRYPATNSAVVKGRARMRRQYHNWESVLNSGLLLPINYYEMYLAKQYGDVIAIQCCAVASAPYGEHSRCKPWGQHFD
jgi:glycosyltransferase involved in cell wall biosynthesis